MAYSASFLVGVSSEYLGWFRASDQSQIRYFTKDLILSGNLLAQTIGRTVWAYLLDSRGGLYGNN